MVNFKGSELYEKGIKYIDALKNYLQSPKNPNYYNNILEKETYGIENISQKIVDTIIQK